MSTSKDGGECIGNLEQHIHKVFANVRVPGEDLVYSSSTDLFNKLDDYCDDNFYNENNKKQPLLITGETGTGNNPLDQKHSHAPVLSHRVVVHLSLIQGNLLYSPTGFKGGSEIMRERSPAALCKK
jgi:hypothetical protein